MLPGLNAGFRVAEAPLRGLVRVLPMSGGRLELQQSQDCRVNGCFDQPTIDEIAHQVVDLPCSRGSYGARWKTAPTGSVVRPAGADANQQR